MNFFGDGLECGPAVATQAYPNQCHGSVARFVEEQCSETSTVDATENEKINEELQRLDEAETIDEAAVNPTETTPVATVGAQPRRNETVAAQPRASNDDSSSHGDETGAPNEQDSAGSGAGSVVAGEKGYKEANEEESSTNVDMPTSLGSRHEDRGETGMETPGGDSKDDSTFSETWEVLRSIEALIRESVNLPPAAPLTACKPDVVSKIPKELIQALEDTVAILASQKRENENELDELEEHEAAQRPSAVQLHEIKDLEMWAIKNKYLTHVSSTTTAPGVLPPEDLSPDTRACGYPVPRVYLYQRLEQQANWKEQRRLRMARKKSSEWKRSVTSSKCTSTPHASDPRLTLKQQMEKHRAQYVDKDLDFICKSKERKKQSLHHHKEVMRKSEDSIEHLKSQTRSIKVEREWRRFQDKVLERIRFQRALYAATVPQEPSSLSTT